MYLLIRGKLNLVTINLMKAIKKYTTFNLLTNIENQVLLLWPATTIIFLHYFSFPKCYF